jgi:hypothetical protein
MGLTKNRVIESVAESWITAFPETSVILPCRGAPIGKVVILQVDDVVLRRRAFRLRPGDYRPLDAANLLTRLQNNFNNGADS